MSNFKFAQDLFLEKEELTRFKDFLDSDGFRKNILENSVNFGLIKSNADTSFANGYVSQDSDLGGDKTVKINPFYGVDENINFIYSPNVINQLVVPNDGNWRWIKIAHQLSNKEVGTVSIATNGDLTGVDTKFTEVLRGQPNFPQKIKFIDSVDNVLEYTLLEVINDNLAILCNPATDLGGIAQFVPETGLSFKVVGTFTAGIAIDEGDKYPFQYDSYVLSLVPETVSNTRPTFVSGSEFFLARVSCTGGVLKIQDKRTEFWDTKGSELAISIERSENPLIGVESIRWEVPFAAATKNIVEIGFGVRSSNHSIDTNSNTLTLASILGAGKYKTVSDFNDGDVDGWRLYTEDGKYSHVISSTKLGGAINLKLDVLDPDSYSNDGGTTLITQTVVCVPNAEEIQFQCTSNLDLFPSANKVVTFPIRLGVGKIELECYADPSVTYNIKYRNKSYKEYSQYALLPSDLANGYLTEVSFTPEGVLKPLLDQVRQTYTADTEGYITLKLCPWSLENFRDSVFIGDLLGVNVISSLTSSVLYDLVVGTSKQYQFIGGTQSIGANTVFNLSPSGAIEGNEFRIHFDCSSLTIGSNTLKIKQGVTTLKDILIGDIYSMYNQEKGIVFTCKYSGSTWIISQNYELGSPGEIKAIDGVISSLFDVSGGVANAKGKVRGLWGYSLCNNAATVDGITVPDLSVRFLIGVGTDGTYTLLVGDQGGNTDINLVIGQLPTHSHSASQGTHSHTSPAHNHGLTTLNESATADGVNAHRVNVAGVGGAVTNLTDDTAVSISTDSAGAITIGDTGGGDDVNIFNPYYAIIYCKKLF